MVIKYRMNNIIFIQARMNSTRLPEKILKKISGKTILEIILERLENIGDIRQKILVTGPSEKNQKLVDESNRLGLDFFCGSEENLLDRYYQACCVFNAENIIRVTGDNPLVDSELIIDGMNTFSQKKCDVLSSENDLFPLGMNFDIMKTVTIKESWNMAIEEFSSREIFQKTFISPVKYVVDANKFKIHNYSVTKIDPRLRLTMDYEEDFILIKKIYESLYQKNNHFALNDIENFLEENPEIKKINHKWCKN